MFLYYQGYKYNKIKISYKVSSVTLIAEHHFIQSSACNKGFGTTIIYLVDEGLETQNNTLSYLVTSGDLVKVE